MKKALVLIITIILTLLNMYFFSKIVSEYIILIKLDHKIEAYISDVYLSSGKASRAVIEYDFQITNQKYHKKSSLALFPLKKYFINAQFSKYYVGRKIVLLTNLNNNFFFPEENIKNKITELILYFMLLELVIIGFGYLSYGNILIKPTSNRKILVYYQNKNYQIKKIEYISDFKFKKYIEDKLFISTMRDSYLCIGISRKKNFIELSKKSNSFFLRKSINSKETEIEFFNENDVNSEIIKYMSWFITKKKEKI